MKLQPMLLDAISALAGDSLNQVGQVVSGEIDYLPTVCTEHDMFVPIISSQVCMAALRLGNARYQIDFFEFLQGPVDRNQPHLIATFTAPVIRYPLLLMIWDQLFVLFIISALLKMIIIIILAYFADENIGIYNTISIYSGSLEML